MCFLVVTKNIQPLIGSRVGLDEMLVARWLARFMASSARIGSAHLNFFHELS
jgi:hypothetical protein